MSEHNNKSATHLWNPLWTILLSFIFTPVFGGLITGLNWRALGNEERALVSFSYFRTTLFIMVAYIFVEPLLRGIPYTQYVLFSLMLILWLVWSFADGIKQLHYVNEQLGDEYHRNLWGKAIMGGVFGWVAYYAVAITVAIGTQLLEGTLF